MVIGNMTDEAASMIDGTVDNINATCSSVLKDLQVEGNCSFAALAGLLYLPPLYFILFATFTKPIFSTIMFGPPKPKPPDKSCRGIIKIVGKQIGQFVLLGLSIAQAISDAYQVWQAIASGCTFWQQLLGSTVILASSSNIGAAVNAFSLSSSLFGTSKVGIIEISLKWAQAHGALEDVTPFQVVGPIGFFYINFLLIIYVPIALVLTVFVLPAIIAYIWLSLLLLILLSIMIVMFVKVHEDVVPRVTSIGSESTLLLRRKETKEDKHRALMEIVDADALAALSKEGATDELYERHMNCYEKTGVTSEAWVSYAWISLMFHPWVILFTPVAVRLYSGHGYMPSLITTLVERHLNVYGCDLAIQTTTKLKLLSLFV